MSADERNDVEDHDLGSAKELASLFSTQFNAQHEQSVSLKKRYIVHISQFPKTQVVAAGLSESSIALLDLASGKILETNTISVHEKQQGRICGVKCSSQNDNELFVCSSVGEVCLYDVRTNEQVNKFWDSENKPKPYTAFDLNSNGRIICVGTEETKTDVFLSFFDVRQSKMVGGYWESHEDDISQVKFHPKNPNLLMSGSLDGLINTFDMRETNEEDALQCTFNTDRSVSSLNWHENDLISCITDSHEVMFYDLKEMELVEEFSRATVTERMRRNCSMECNLIDCHNMGPAGGDQIALMAASNFNNGECLRTLTYDAAGKTLRTHGNFNGNRQIVRCSYYNDTHNYFLTGGEGGIITLWRAGDSEEPADAQEATTAIGKAKKSKSHKSKPY